MSAFTGPHVTVRDPVCGMTLDPSWSNGTSVGAHTYYFCAPVCRTRFTAEPAKYAPPAPRKSFLLGRFLGLLPT